MTEREEKRKTKKGWLFDWGRGKREKQKRVDSLTEREEKEKNNTGLTLWHREMKKRNTKKGWLSDWGRGKREKQKRVDSLTEGEEKRDKQKALNRDKTSPLVVVRAFIYKFSCSDTPCCILALILKWTRWCWLPCRLDCCPQKCLQWNVAHHMHGE